MSNMLLFIAAISSTLGMSLLIGYELILNRSNLTFFQKAIVGLLFISATSAVLWVGQSIVTHYWG